MNGIRKTVCLYPKKRSADSGLLQSLTKIWQHTRTLFEREWYPATQRATQLGCKTVDLLFPGALRGRPDSGYPQLAFQEAVSQLARVLAGR